MGTSYAHATHKKLTRLRKNYFFSLGGGSGGQRFGGKCVVTLGGAAGKYL